MKMLECTKRSNYNICMQIVTDRTKTCYNSDNDLFIVPVIVKVLKYPEVASFNPPAVSDEPFHEVQCVLSTEFQFNYTDRLLSISYQNLCQITGNKRVYPKVSGLSQ
jgi:hypothetical protein